MKVRVERKRERAEREEAEDDSEDLYTRLSEAQRHQCSGSCDAIMVMMKIVLLCTPDVLITEPL